MADVPQASIKGCLEESELQSSGRPDLPEQLTVFAFIVGPRPVGQSQLAMLNGLPRKNLGGTSWSRVAPEAAGASRRPPDQGDGRRSIVRVGGFGRSCTFHPFQVAVQGPHPKGCPQQSIAEQEFLEAPFPNVTLEGSEAGSVDIRGCWIGVLVGCRRSSKAVCMELSAAAMMLKAMVQEGGEADAIERTGGSIAAPALARLRFKDGPSRLFGDCPRSFEQQGGRVGCQVQPHHSSCIGIDAAQETQRCVTGLEFVESVVRISTAVAPG